MIKVTRTIGTLHFVRASRMKIYYYPLRWQVYFITLCSILDIWLSTYYPSLLLVNVVYEWLQVPNWIVLYNKDTIKLILFKFQKSV